MLPNLKNPTEIHISEPLNKEEFAILFEPNLLFFLVSAKNFAYPACATRFLRAKTYCYGYFKLCQVTKYCVLDRVSCKSLIYFSGDGATLQPAYQVCVQPPFPGQSSSPESFK